MSDSADLPDRDETLTHAPSVLACQVGTDVVLLNSTSGRYYALDEVGSRIFELIGSGHSLGAVHDILIDTYDAAPDVLWSDLVAFCTRMSSLGIVVRPHS